MWAWARGAKSQRTRRVRVSPRPLKIARPAPVVSRARARSLGRPSARGACVTFPGGAGAAARYVVIVIFKAAAASSPSAQSFPRLPLRRGFYHCRVIDEINVHSDGDCVGEDGDLQSLKEGPDEISESFFFFFGGGGSSNSDLNRLLFNFYNSYSDL